MAKCITVIHYYGGYSLAGTTTTYAQFVGGHMYGWNTTDNLNTSRVKAPMAGTIKEIHAYVMSATATTGNPTLYAGVASPADGTLSITGSPGVSLSKDPGWYSATGGTLSFSEGDGLCFKFIGDPGADGNFTVRWVIAVVETSGNDVFHHIADYNGQTATAPVSWYRSMSAYWSYSTSEAATHTIKMPTAVTIKRLKVGVSVFTGGGTVTLLGRINGTTDGTLQKSINGTGTFYEDTLYDTLSAGDTYGWETRDTRNPGTIRTTGISAAICSADRRTVITTAYPGGFSLTSNNYYGWASGNASSFVSSETTNEPRLKVPFAGTVGGLRVYLKTVGTTGGVSFRKGGSTQFSTSAGSAPQWLAPTDTFSVSAGDYINFMAISSGTVATLSSTSFYLEDPAPAGATRRVFVVS